MEFDTVRRSEYDRFREDGGFIMPEKKTTQDAQVRRWRQRHPLFLLCLLVGGFAFLSVCGTWLYLKLTIPAQIERELRAAGLPLTGEELETWNHPAPDQDGTATYLAAVALFRSVCKHDDGATLSEVQFYKTREDFAANRHKVEALFTSMKPAVEQLRQVARYPAFTVGRPYRSPTSTADYASTFDYRQFALLLHQEARHATYTQKDLDAAISKIEMLFTLNSRIQTYSTFEYLVSIAVNATARSAIGILMEECAIAPERLCSIGRIANEARSDNFFKAMGGECVLMHQLYHTEYPSTVESRSPFFRLHCFLFSDLEELDKIRSTIRLSVMYKALYADYIPALTQIKEDARRASSPFSLAHYYSMVSPDTFVSAYLGFIADGFKANTEKRLFFIACELAARALEGKPVPENLSGAEFPVDPFNGKPFDLIKKDGALILRSPGPDLKLSPDLPATNATNFRPGQTKSDDITVVLSRKALTPKDTKAQP